MRLTYCTITYIFLLFFSSVLQADQSSVGNKSPVISDTKGDVFINYSSYVSNNKAYTDLKIVDMFLVDSSTVEFKLKNSGNDSAFLKEISFAFFHGGVGNMCCMMVGYDKYDYNFYAALNSNSINIKSDIKEVNNEKNLLNEKCRVIVKHHRVVGGVHKSWDTKKKTENVLLSVKESPLLKIHQVVPPKGVDRFRIKFTLPTPNNDNETISPFSPFDGCCAIVHYDAFAIIKYDQNDILVTPKFRIAFIEEKDKDKDKDKNKDKE